MSEKRFKILAVDDTKTNIDILLELLGDRYDVIPALSGEKALKITSKIDIDLILLDIMMPDMDGYKVCSILKSQEKTKDIPILFITAKTDQESIVNAFRIGGVDYVTKPFQSLELIARINTHLQLSDTLKTLEFLATRDSMTGALNRRKFFELASKKFEVEKNNLYAVMIDIDKFKNINDAHGHHIGDKVIKLLANTIDGLICQKSIFGRLGGEEFALVCTHESIDIIKDKVEYLRKSIESIDVTINEKESIKFTISSGISQITPDIKNIDELLKIADDALYKAKGEGRNKVIFREIK